MYIIDVYYVYISNKLKMKIYNELIQGTDEWLDVRKMKMTASQAQAIASAGKGLDSLIRKLLAENYSSGERERYTNSDIERGNELEPKARKRYEKVTKSKVVEVGFVESEVFSNTGCSPDGLVGKEGMTEFKCPRDEKFFNMLLDGVHGVSSYLWQCQMQMLVCEREWVDLVFYNPNYTQDLIIHRVNIDSEKQDKLKDGLIKGNDIINQYQEQINNTKNNI